MVSITTKEIILGYCQGVESTIGLAEDHLTRAIVEKNKKEFESSLLSFHKAYYILESGFNSCGVMVRSMDSELQDADLVGEIKEMLSEILDIIFFEGMDRRSVSGVKGEVLIGKLSYLKFLAEELKTMR